MEAFPDGHKQPQLLFKGNRITNLQSSNARLYPVSYVVSKDRRAQMFAPSDVACCVCVSSAKYANSIQSVLEPFQTKLLRFP